MYYILRHRGLLIVVLIAFALMGNLGMSLRAGVADMLDQGRYLYQAGQAIKDGTLYGFKLDRAQYELSTINWNDQAALMIFSKPTGVALNGREITGVLQATSDKFGWRPLQNRKARSETKTTIYKWFRVDGKIVAEYTKGTGVLTLRPMVASYRIEEELPASNFGRRVAEPPQWKVYLRTASSSVLTLFKNLLACRTNAGLPS
ncbi:MAG: hypothetical protein ACAI35_19410 [Candidatus Methylacidiphilales bacterium]